MGNRCRMGSWGATMFRSQHLTGITFPLAFSITMMLRGIGRRIPDNIFND
jgi:hypothetical protein